MKLVLLVLYHLDLRDGGEVLLNHRVFIRDQFKGTVPLSSRSRAGKTNLMKVVLFWVLFNSGYGKLILTTRVSMWLDAKQARGTFLVCANTL